MIEIQRVLGEIRDVQVIAAGREIAEWKVLRKLYGAGRWRKLKGVAVVETTLGEMFLAEVHWYEAHGLGKRKMKVKRRLGPTS